MPHDPRECQAIADPPHHCYTHDEDEPVLEGSLTCFECSHVFLSEANLLAEHNRTMEEVYASDGNQQILAALSAMGVPPPEPETDVAQVYTCPFCMHDF